MNSVYYLLYCVSLLLGYAIYFKIARSYMIVDLPNHRTMHLDATIRGGGVVPFLVLSVSVPVLGQPGWYFLAGFILIGITGLLDDIIDLAGGARFPLQIVAVLLLMQELHLLSSGVFLVLAVLVVATGALNAFNFMDGLNGMTVGYSSMFIVTMLFVNNHLEQFTSNDFLLLILIALISFGALNFRKRAVCFAGDVGSLSIAFIIVYLTIKLVNDTHQLIYILFLTLYGVDTIFTIIQRLYLKQNIFEAHRMHLFQVAVSKTKLTHLQMSSIYMILQLGINALIIAMADMSIERQLIFGAALLLIISLVYVVTKRKLLLQE